MKSNLNSQLTFPLTVEDVEEVGESEKERLTPRWDNPKAKDRRLLIADGPAVSQRLSRLPAKHSSQDNKSELMQEGKGVGTHVPFLATGSGLVECCLASEFLR